MIPKFRAFLKSTKDIRKVLLIDYLNRMVDLEGGEIEHYFEDVILMQSTGLKDKNGVEIFEGDIVKLSVQNGFDYLDNEICTVKRSISHSGLVCATCKTDVEYRIFNTELFEEYVYEVIGNIYENPELLEAE